MATRRRQLRSPVDRCSPRTRPARRLLLRLRSSVSGVIDTAVYPLFCTSSRNSILWLMSSPPRLNCCSQNYMETLDKFIGWWRAISERRPADIARVVGDSTRMAHTDSPNVLVCFRWTVRVAPFRRFASSDRSERSTLSRRSSILVWTVSKHRHLWPIRPR